MNQSKKVLFYAPIKYKICSFVKTVKELVKIATRIFPSSTIFFKVFIIYEFLWKNWEVNAGSRSKSKFCAFCNNSRWGVLASRNCIFFSYASLIPGWALLTWPPMHWNFLNVILQYLHLNGLGSVVSLPLVIFLDFLIFFYGLDL